MINHRFINTSYALSYVVNLALAQADMYYCKPLYQIFFTTLQAKKGVKRKADTTTPIIASHYDTPFDSLPDSLQTGIRVAKLPPARRGSSRQIKKPKKDLPDEQSVSCPVEVSELIICLHAMLCYI